MIQKDNSVYRFGPFVLLPHERQLLRDGKPVSLTPKSFELLELLVREAGHVVTKEALIAALWSKRFVLESNLTKHIWFVRKALEDGGEYASYIETVSKAGYRFNVPVTREEADPTVKITPAHPMPPQRRLIGRWRDARTATGVALFLAIAAMAVWWFGPGRQQSFPWTANRSGRSVAIFEFDNLSHSAREAWIGPAFADMLRTDVSQGGQLYLLPEEIVRAAGRDAPKTAAFSPHTLEKLRKRLAVDYVITGTYLASSAENAPIRLDIAIQDARSGATVTAFSRNGSSNDLPALVTGMGTELRKDLGIKSQSKNDLKLVANAQPPTLDVTRRVGFAIDALHRYDAGRAKDELLQAIVEAPGYAPAYVYLAKAWLALGYKQKAAAAAKQAADRATNLPEFMRLQIEALSHETQFQWPQAIEVLRKLVALQADNPESQLELASTQLAAGKPKDAQATIDALRAKGGSIADDPRLELESAQIGASQDDMVRAKSHAAIALKLAEARGNAGFAADAASLLGVALTSSDPEAALAMLNRALEIYRRIGNPSGEAAVNRDIGNVFLDNQAQRARDEYQKSLAQYQAIGDESGMASTYADIGITLWNTGDRDGAETAVRNALAIRQKTGDKRGEAWALAALGVELSDDRASDEVIDKFKRAAAIDDEIGEHANRGFALYSLSDIYRMRGAFAQAQAVCIEAQAEYTKVHDAVNQSLADFQCAQILLDHGEMGTAATLLTRVYKDASERRDVMTQGNVLLTQGQIALGNRRWTDAAALIAEAGKRYKTGGMTPGEAVAASLHALCDAATGDVAQRDTNMARAKSLRDGMTEKQEIYEVDIALAELHNDTQKLEDIEADARQRQWPGWVLEAQLAELRVLLAKNATADAKPLRRRIAVAAKAGGFGWVLSRLP